MSPVIRPPALAGQWYDADPTVLRRSVRAYLDGADPSAAPAGRPAVLVVPHAGHMYSGPTAGRGWGLLEDQDYDRIVLLAPNHRMALAVPSCPDADAYATPLGEVAVDTEGRRLLLESGAVICAPAAHADEHAEEIQLPFLQVLTDDPPPVLPILVPRLADSDRARLVDALAPWCDDRTLWVVSTDFTHYGVSFGYAPFRDDLDRRIRDLDMGAVAQIEAGDAQGLLEYGRRTGITMCGLEAMAVVLSLPWRGPLRPRLLDYARSGDRDGDYAFSVSYAALAAPFPEPEASP